MIRRRLRLCWMAALTALLVAGPVTQAEEPPFNVILFGWDGAQRNHVNECLARGELPTLKKIAEQGAMVETDIIGTTDTKAGWSQILTGYDPKVTGVYSNGKYDAVPKGLSLFERLEALYGPDKFVTVAVIGKRAHCGETNPPKKVRLDAKGATRGTIIEENGVKYRVTPASPYYNMYTALEVWEAGLTLDEKVGAKALQYLQKYKGKPFLFFVHFAEVDHSGHRYGENSKEYNDALISNDTWTGKILEKVKELGIADKTIVIVTADHGFNEGEKNHKYAPYTFLASTSKKIIRNGLRADVTPTIYDLLGVDTSAFEPKLDGSPLTKPAPPGMPKFVPREAKATEKKAGAAKGGQKPRPKPRQKPRQKPGQ